MVVTRRWTSVYNSWSRGRTRRSAFTVRGFTASHNWPSLSSTTCCQEYITKTRGYTSNTLSHSSREQPICLPRFGAFVSLILVSLRYGKTAFLFFVLYYVLIALSIACITDRHARSISNPTYFHRVAYRQNYLCRRCSSYCHWNSCSSSFHLLEVSKLLECHVFSRPEKRTHSWSNDKSSGLERMVRSRGNSNDCPIHRKTDCKTQCV